MSELKRYEPESSTICGGEYENCKVYMAEYEDGRFVKLKDVLLLAQPPIFDPPSSPYEQPVPEGYEKMDSYSNGKNLIVLGVPRDDSDHNCDAMGCGTLDHVVAVIPLVEVDWSGPKAPS